MGPGMPVGQSHNPVVVFSTQISHASDIQSHKNVNRFLIVPSSNCKMTYATDPSIGITTYGRPTGYSRRMRSTGFCLALGRFTFGVGLAPRWRPRPEPGRSVCDFLSAWRFAPKAPLLIVGFLWISLDSLVRIETCQWVTPLGAGKLFSQPFSLAFAAPGREPGGRGHPEAQECSCRKLSLISEFLQQIVVRAVLFRPASIQNQLALEERESRPFHWSGS
jgi:hypothetical protein